MEGHRVVLEGQARIAGQPFFQEWFLATTRWPYIPKSLTFKPHNCWPKVRRKIRKHQPSRVSGPRLSVPCRVLMLVHGHQWSSLAVVFVSPMILGFQNLCG